MAKIELSVNKLIKNMVVNDVFLATSLRRGYINLSAVARDLQPGIEKKMGESVNLDAIVSALKRNRDISRKFDGRVLEALSQTSVQLVTSVTKFVIPANRNDGVLNSTHETKFPGTFYISTSPEFTTLIVEDRNLSSFSESTKRGVIDRKPGLAVIVLKSPSSILDIPGYLMSVYSKLAFAGINIEETTNSYTDAIIVVRESESSEAYSAIRELIEFARGETEKGSI